MNNIKYNSDLIQNVIQFLSKNEIPKNLSQGQYYRFKDRFGNKNYTIKDGKLFFKNLEVIPEENRYKILLKL